MLIDHEPHTLRNKYLASCCCITGAPRDWVVGDLHSEVVIVDNRPCSPHSAGLELVVKGAEMRVAEEPTVPEYLGPMVVTLVGHWPLGFPGTIVIQCRPVDTTVVLLHLVLDSVAHTVVADVTLATTRVHPDATPVSP